MRSVRLSNGAHRCDEMQMVHHRELARVPSIQFGWTNCKLQKDLICSVWEEKSDCIAPVRDSQISTAKQCKQSTKHFNEAKAHLQKNDVHSF